MDISKLMTDDAILAEIGICIARYRIEGQMTQADLTEQEGVSKRNRCMGRGRCFGAVFDCHPDLAVPGFIAGAGSYGFRTTLSAGSTANTLAQVCARGISKFPVRRR